MTGDPLQELIAKAYAWARGVKAGRIRLKNCRGNPGKRSEQAARRLQIRAALLSGMTQRQTIAATGASQSVVSKVSCDLKREKAVAKSKRVGA